MDSSTVPVRCGCGPKARRLRDTVDCDRHLSSAIVRVDRCVAFFGVDSSVPATRGTTADSGKQGGTPASNTR
ncbi:hypothetical protein L1856_08825 [Streptomyces sp. Tue 6430]|nr:hypothetical protein [Streptomyces sp. Tue 6430]